MITKDYTVTSAYNDTSDGGKLGRCVYVAGLARRLIRKGHTVIDMKPNHSHDGGSVMVFEPTEEMEKDLMTLVALLKEKRLKDIPYGNTSNNDKPGRCVYVPGLARGLLHLGHRMMDIKPNRTDPTKKKSVYVFEITDTLDSDLLMLVDEYKKKRENSAGKSEVNEKIRETFLDREQL